MRKLLTVLTTVTLSALLTTPGHLGTRGLPGSSVSAGVVASRRGVAAGELVIKMRSALPELDQARGGDLLEAIGRSMGDAPRKLGANGAEPLLRAHSGGRLERIVTDNGLDRIFVLKFDSDVDLDRVMADLKATGALEYAEPNYLIEPGGLIPNDPRFDEQWALLNSEVNIDGLPSTPGADIKAPDAWAITTGAPNLIIAVTDTGVDATHPDLAANIYTNPGEIAGNGIDDDHNGYVDDVHGFNVADNNGDTSDIVGHGTEMAGIIAAVINNRTGMSGVCQSKILPVRFFKRVGPGPADVDGTVADAARALIYSIAAGATIINASWSTMLVPGQVADTEAQALKDAVKACSDAGVLLVCIAGNGGFNNDLSPVYPGHYQFPNQIVVAASDYNDELWHVVGVPFEFKSGFGAQTVDLTAPGVSVFTTQAHGDCPLCAGSSNPDDWYTTTDGTSASAAFVSGVASLVKTKYPEATAPVIRRRILAGVDDRPGLHGYVASGGRLNAYGALTAQLTITAPALSKLKYKPGPGKLFIFGDAMQVGAVAIVGATSYPTTPRGEGVSPLVVRLPAGALAPGVAVQVKLRNPDGGESQPITLTP